MSILTEMVVFMNGLSFGTPCVHCVGVKLCNSLMSILTETEAFGLIFDTPCVHCVGVKLCNNFMSILTETEVTDTELLVYTMTLINKVCYGLKY